MTLPTDRDARNALPVWDGGIAYFPDVWAELAKVSVLGNKQHNLGDKLFWNTHVSTDHANKVIRHMLDDAAGNVYDDDGQTMHLAKALWRIGAMLQLRCWARDGKDEHGRPINRAVADEGSIKGTATTTTEWSDPQAVEDPPVCQHGYTRCRVCQFP